MRIVNGVLAVSLVLSMAALMAACSKKSDDPQHSADPANSAVVVPVPAVSQNTAPSPAQTQAPATQQAAAPQAQNSKVIVRTNFKCANGAEFSVEFKSQPSRAEVLFGKQAPLVLKDEIPASGFWYRNAQYELRGQGRNAQWTVAGKGSVACQSAL